MNRRRAEVRRALEVARRLQADREASRARVNERLSQPGTADEPRDGRAS